MMSRTSGQYTSRLVGRTSMGLTPLPRASSSASLRATLQKPNSAQGPSSKDPDRPSPPARTRARELVPVVGSLAAVDPSETPFRKAWVLVPLYLPPIRYQVSALRLVAMTAFWNDP